MIAIDRRKFLTGSASFAAAAAIPPPSNAAPAGVAREAGVKLKLGLNAYSFDKRLSQDGRGDHPRDRCRGFRLVRLHSGYR